MKKVLGFISIFVLCCICFCGCSDFEPFKPVSSQPTPAKTYRVYVCGAVANEGYYEVPEGTDYGAVVEMAGLLPQTYFVQNPQTLVTENLVLPLQWYDGATERSCVNVNGGYVEMRREIDGISQEVINKIADYIEENGKITDKTLLKEILGDDYADNFYKFFVRADDYEKVG